MRFTYAEFDLSDVRTFPLESRQSKTRVEDFGRPVAGTGPIAAFVDSLPDILAGADLKAVVEDGKLALGIPPFRGNFREFLDLLGVEACSGWRGRRWAGRNHVRNIA